MQEHPRPRLGVHCPESDQKLHQEKTQKVRSGGGENGKKSVEIGTKMYEMYGMSPLERTKRGPTTST